MKVLGYQSHAPIQNAQGGRTADYQNPSAFISPGEESLPRNLDQLAKGMGQLGGAMHQIGIQERADKLSLALTTDIQSALLQDGEIQEELKEQFKGPDADQSIDEYTNRTQQIIGNLTSKYQHNPSAVQHIQDRLGSTFLSGTNAMRRYKNEQRSAYQAGVLDKQTSIMEEVYSNPDSSFEQQKQASIDYATLRRKQLIHGGWDDESADRQVQDDLKAFAVKDTLRTLDLLEKTNPIEGRALLEGAISGKMETPRGIRNNNPGNIIKTASPWEGEVEGKDKRFKSFATPEHGIAAVSKNLLSYGNKGLNTVSSIIKRWAPPHENNTQAYITKVSRELNIAPDQPLDLKDPTTLFDLTSAIISHENGGLPYSVAQLDAGVNAALGLTPLPESVPDGNEGQQQEDWLPAQVSELKTILTPQQLAERRISMNIAAEKQEQQNFIQKYSELPPAEAVLAVANDPELIARPDLQKKVLGHFDLMEAAEERITKAQETALKGQLVESIEKVDLNAPDSSRQFEKIISDAPYPMQAELTKIAMGRVTGEDKISDPVAADEAETRILAGESVNIRGEYGGKLNLVTQRRLEKLQSSAEFKEFVIKEKALFEAELDKYSRTRNLTKTKRGDLYRQYEASIPEGGFKDIAQRQKAFNLFWRSVTVDKNWALEKEIRGYQERDYAEKGYYPSTGAAYQEIYTKTKEQIKAREGVEREPDEKELLNVYQSALGITKGDK